MNNKFTVLFAGRRGVSGSKGDKGDKGDSGRSIMVRGQWASGTTYVPGDAVTGDSTAAQGITSLYVQRDGVPESTSTVEPRLDLGRWAEIGATDLSNVTGAIWRVIQHAHGFTGVGQPVTYSQSANRWILATNSAGQPAAVAVVREIVSPNEVILQGSGEISGLDPSIIIPGIASQFTAGRFYYASSAPGFLTETPTVSAVNFTSNAMLLATGPSSGVVLQWQATPNVVGRRAVGYDSFFYDATPGQTVFSGPDLNANVMTYATANQMRVLVDGVDVSSFDGFTALTGASVTLVNPMVGGERVEIRVLADPTTAIAPATAAVVDSIQTLFDGVTRRFPLTVNAGAALALGPTQNVLVWLDGNTQEPGADYLVVAGVTTDSDIEFTTAPPAGTRFWALAGVPTTNVLPPIASFNDLFVSNITQTETLNVTASATVAGTASINSLVANTADINAGTIDGTVIGGTVAAAGTFTTLAATGNLTAQQNILVSGSVVLNNGTNDSPSVQFIASGNDTWEIDNRNGQLRLIRNSVNVPVNFSSSAMSVNLPITGTAVTQSDRDTTAGRLTKVGDFGLGATNSSPGCPDLDSPTLASGTYNVFGTTPNVASRPPGTDTFGTIVVNRYDGNRCWQVWYNRKDGPGSVRKWIRGSDSAGDWSAWEEILTSDNVTQSATDTTAGRLLKVGDFGLGGNAISYSGNVDSLTIPTGFYFVDAAATGTKPLGISGNYGFLQVELSGANGRISQTWVREGGLGGVQIYRRFYVSSAWTPWRRLFDQGAILGTVSQSGGVPTGAIIERGSNANGEFTRFADGTQICRSTLTSSASGAQTWTFPAAFAVVPQSFVSARSEVPRFATYQSPTATTVAFNIWASDGVTRVVVFTELTALGRWF